MLIFRSVTRGVKRKRESEEAIQPRDSHTPVATSIIEPQQPSTSRTTAEPSCTPIVGDTVECKTCKRNVSRRYYAQHLRSNIHKNNSLKFQHSYPNVELIETAFGNRLLTYRITSVQEKSNLEFETPELFFEGIKTSVNKLIDDAINQLTIFKVSFILNAEFVQESKGINNFFDFNVLSWTICKGDDRDAFFENLKNSLINKISNFEKKDSGWSLKLIKYLDMNINQFNPLRGSSYIDLPHDIKVKKGIINVQNYDHECLKWAILSALYPVKDSSQRVSSYIKHQNKLNFSDISFPVKITDIHRVEKLNEISINVFGLHYNENSKTNEVNGPLYFTKCRKPTHINLLYISRGSQGHYCYIKNLSRLVSRQISTTNYSLHICDGCLLAFYSNDQLTNHQKNDCGHIIVELPNRDMTKKDWLGNEISGHNIIFDKYQRKLKLPFVVYADFEAFLNPISSCDPDASKSYTKNIQQHEMYSFGYFIKCSFDDSLSRYRSYTGSDCAKVFMDTLYNDLAQLKKFIHFRKQPIPLNQSDLSRIGEANNKCFICDNELKSQSVFSYDWTTGKFQGVAHKSCDHKFIPPSYVPVFFHNLTNYDAHFIVQALNFREGPIDIIPLNKEKYISFSKQLKFDKRYLSLRFVDSFRFMSSSLDSLARNLQEHQFHELRRQYPQYGDFKLLKQKGIFPYEYMKSSKALEASSLPIISDFYSSLTDSCITSADYQHAQNVWTHFNCKSMLDYSNLYLKTDVLLLTDIFENFRTVCLETYNLDSAHYFTAPGLSWDAMLKITGVQLELLTDFDKVAFIKRGLRGGISQCSNRYAKSNNYYMPDFDPNESSSYLIYLDANNLYGWAMSQHLPVGEFEWVGPNTDFYISNDADYGYILEVDLEYPDSLHNTHSDLPFCAEHIIDESRQKKLIPNLNNKIKYIIHYRNLIQCLENGLQLKKVHRILKFKQTNWLKKYINLNTTLRIAAKTDFEKDFYKLMNNAVFGKTMENIEKRVDVKLLTHWSNHGHIKGVQSYIARPEFHSISIFSESLAAVQLKKTKLVYNKPIYLGFCILDISKTLMYDFHYGYMQRKFQKNLKLLYSDTDSFIYQIFTEDFYNDIKQDIQNHFDTSDYAPNNIYGFPCLNKKKLGFFKDENKGKILKEFVGLRSKMYALNVEDSIVAKAKGVNKCVTAKFQIQDYKNCLNEKKNVLSEMCRFRSIKHVIFTQKINKISLSYSDTKRYLCKESFDTLAWGHYTLR